MNINIIETLFSIFGIWILYKLFSVLFRIVGTYRCDCCGKDIIPLLEKNHVICHKCMDDHSE